MNNDDYSWMAHSGHDPVEQHPPWDAETVPHGWADTSTMTAAPPRYTPTAASPAVKENEDALASRDNANGLRRARARATRSRRRPLVSQDVAALTLTVIVPAHNEEAGLPETLNAILSQTMPPDRVLVVDDGSHDRTSEIARSLGAEVFRREESSGSKSQAFNYGLLECDTDLILNVDGDTVICDTYIERVKAQFADPKVAVAAGIVGVWNPKGAFQRGRQIEYLVNQHLFRPIQNFWASPTVCSGAACMYRREPLAANGGFPDDTVGEDMDYTWRAMLNGYKAVYVADAECYAVDPKTSAQLRTQLWRWMSGYAQCVRLHWREVLRRKKVLALVILASMLDMCIVPLWLAGPFIAAGHVSLLKTLVVALLGTDLLITLPVAVAAAFRRSFNPLWVLASIPFIWIHRVFGVYYFIKAMIWELVLVPCEWKTSLAVFKKGH